MTVQEQWTLSFYLNSKAETISDESAINNVFVEK